MTTPLVSSRLSLQSLGTTIQLNAHLAALRYANRAAIVRYASGKSKGDSRLRDQPKKKKKQRIEFKQYNLRDAEQYSLCDAIRYIKAFEAGRAPTSPKYDLAVKLRTIKNGPTVRNQLRLPHAVVTSVRICVICPPDSKHAEAATKAGASVVGEDTVFDAVKEGRIEFDRCICHQDSVAKMNKAGLGRILGPRGLMPSAKFGTIVKDVGSSVKRLVGGSEYRERNGVLRMAIGQLGFTPEQLQANIKTLMSEIKKDVALLSDRVQKDIHEVVLSSTNAPGFSLNGDFRSPESPPTRDLSVM
ncbi:MAG: hypothetical protein LQ338_006198 [Usnochroma carphineum]|nr:MAG: hypothetical protein LQ338_006198 [Usnochroma carphineum]